MPADDPKCQATPSNLVPICAAGVVLLLLMLWVVGYTVLDARNSVRRQAEQEAGNIALTLDRDIGRVVTVLDLSLQAAARGLRTPGIADMDPTLRQALLFDGATAAEGFGGVFIADSTGRVVYDSRADSRGSVRINSIADREFFRQHRDHPAQGLTISVPLRIRTGPSVGEWFLAITRRIDNPDGSFAGTATVALKLGYFQSLFGAFALGSRGIISLIGPQGRLVTRWPYRDADVGRDVTDGAIYDYLARSRAGTFESTSAIDGITRLYSYRQVSTLPLLLSVGFATHDIYADWTQKAATVCVAMVALLLLGLGLVWALKRELRRRLLAEAATRHAAARAQHAARELAQAIAPLDAMFHHSPESILLARVGPDGTFAYEVVNPTWESIIGVPAEAAIGKPPDAFLPPALAETILAGWSECVRQRQPVRFNFSPPARPADEDWESLVVPIIGDDGKVYRLLIIGRDMTEHNRTEARLRQSQKMEVIGRLAAGVSHDFNNVLQVISGAVDIVRQDGGLPPRADEFLIIADQAARRGADLTHQLLAYARQHPLKPSLLDIAPILTDLATVLTRTTGSNIAVTTQTAPGVGLVWADRSQLETALMNLAINAVHAMPTGGSLHLRAASADAASSSELTPGRYVVITVTDTGTGIPAHVMSSMFDPFFTTKGEDGNGLGLAMVQGFSRQSGGDVRASSTLGEGTSFEIWLPEVTGAAAPPPEPIEPARRDDTHFARVLLVDDAPDVRITLEAFLRNAGFAVHTATNGFEALETLSAGAPFDILVTDQMMPGMTGLELIHNARIAHPGLPALLICGFFDLAVFASDAQSVTRLHKPFKRDTLIAHVSALLTESAASPG
jgi:PAS domain S-box-containing protein